MQSWLFLCPRFLTTAGVIWALASTASRAQETSVPQFETVIRPILREYCLDCHGATDNPEAALDLRLVRFMVSGGESGPALDLASPGNSLLLERVVSGDMPPGETKVSAEKIALLDAWIRAGAPTLRPEPATIEPGIPITEEDRSYWAYQPVARPQVAPDPTRGHIRTPIDALIAQAMPVGLTFSEDATRATLVQRVYYDLLGLPATAAELRRWEQYVGDDWYETMVDELLRSPHYGERWGRHWLDAAGYADSDGSTLADAERAWAWRYRDYVIRSLNDDKPFNQFITEQLAGDELAGPAQGDWTPQQIEWLTATGFLRMVADGTGSGDNSPEARNKTIADTLQIVGSTLLSSSLHCAQCHDHRYDPISHRDYFAIRSVFEPALDWQQWKTPGERLVSLSTAADRQLAAEVEAEAQKIAAEREAKQSEYMKQALEQELAKFEEPLRGELRTAYEKPAAERTPEQNELLGKNPSVNLSPGVLYQYLPQAAEDLKTFDTRISEVRSRKPAETYLQALVEPADHATTTRLFHRGDHNQPTVEIAPAGLSVVSPEGARPQFPNDDPNLPTTGRRLAFAHWLTDPANPLMSRALVNRVWLHHFGRGIVATPGDFGQLGSQPTHPQVLDWLASEWVAQGWSLKKLHRIILMSTVYRQSSYRDPVREAIDPENQFYWRKSLQRLDAEVLRDSILSVSGELNPQPFGPPIPIIEDETGQVRVDPAQPRRSIYVRWRRTQPVAMLQTFDAPVMNVNCDVRPVSTVATQSLMMLNGEFAIDQAAKIAKLSIANAAESTANGEVMASPSLAATIPTPPAPLWQYGTGTLDEASGIVSDFQPLSHFNGSQWQGGQNVPDAEIGWVLLHASGGHPGNPQHPAIRRWVAPQDGELTVSGTLGHHSENGDGVRARIVTPVGFRGQWQAKHTTLATEAEPLAVSKGQPIDFIVDCLAHETSDSFTWDVKLSLKVNDGSRKVYESTTGFRGPPEDYSQLPMQVVAAWNQTLLRSPSEQELLGAIHFAHEQLELMHNDPSLVPAGSSAGVQVLTNICQMLVNSNEFLYID